MIRTHHRRAGLLLAVATAMLLCSCTTFQSKVAVAPPEPARPASSAKVDANQSPLIAHYRNTRCYVHKVRWPEESLERVAQWYTGSGANWKILWRSTPNLPTKHLRKGNVVFIPVDLMQIETPMPRQYVQQQRPPQATTSLPRKTSSVAPAAPKPVEDDAQPQPFGPRPFPKKSSP